MESNYEKQAANARELFLTYNQQEIIERYGLAHDEEYLYVTFLSDPYRISRKDGRVERLLSVSAGEDHRKVFSAGEGKDNAQEGAVLCEEFNVVMTIYDALCYPKRRPHLLGEWCSLAGLQVTQSPSSDLVNQRYANQFSGETARLGLVCRMLGGRIPKIAAGADVSWEFDAFPFFPVQFRFWEGDEEFPAKIQFLLDRNSLQFLHFETLYYLLRALLEKLSRLFAAS